MSERAIAKFLEEADGAVVVPSVSLGASGSGTESDSTTVKFPFDGWVVGITGSVNNQTYSRLSNLKVRIKIGSGESTPFVTGEDASSSGYVSLRALFMIAGVLPFSREICYKEPWTFDFTNSDAAAAVPELVLWVKKKRC